MAMINPVVSSGPRWYALQVQNRYGVLTADILSNKGYRVFAPICRTRRQWSDRIAEVDAPLFPGYIFCRFDLSDRRIPVLTTPGVIRAVGIGRIPYPVDDGEIEAIQEVVKLNLVAEPHQYLTVGTRVCIKVGALAGVEGIVKQLKNKSRLVLSISLIQRSIAVDIDAAWIAPVPEVQSAAAMCAI